MSKDSPANVLAQFCDDEGWIGSPSDWTYFIDNLPANPSTERDIAFFNYGHSKDGRLMEGTVILKPMVQIVARSVYSHEAFSILDFLLEELSKVKQTDNHIVTIEEGSQWHLKNWSFLHGPVLIGQEEHNGMFRYSLNGKMTVTKVTP